MRPRGAIRQALAASAWEIASSSPLGGATWRDAAVHAHVGFDVARTTIENMGRSGELRSVGTVHTEHACRPMTLWAPPALAESAGAQLVDAMRSWAEFK